MEELTFVYFILFVCGVFLVLLAVSAVSSANQKIAEQEAQMSPEELERYKKAKVDQAMTRLRGPKNPQMICPHCQTKGEVRTKSVVESKGIHGGKATAALLTGGASVLVTGLSRKVTGTQARCDTCDCSWSF
jgi:hypothetical protein